MAPVYTCSPNIIKTSSLSVSSVPVGVYVYVYVMYMVTVPLVDVSFKPYNDPTRYINIFVILSLEMKSPLKNLSHVVLVQCQDHSSHWWSTYCIPSTLPSTSQILTPLILIKILGEKACCHTCLGGWRN